MNVWTYWEGPQPKYIDVCIASLARVCSSPVINFRCVTPETLGDYVEADDIHPNYKKLPVAPKSSAIRSALLARHGGLWCDADTIGIKSPLELLCKYHGVDCLYVMWSNMPPRVINGYIYFQPGSKTAREWLDQTNHKLKTNPESAMRWTGLGERLLTPIVQPRIDSHQIPLSTFLPIEIDCDVQTFFETGDFREPIMPHTVAYGLNNSWFMYHRRRAMQMPARHWRESPLLIHQLLWHALKKNRGHA